MRRTALLPSLGLVGLALAGCAGSSARSDLSASAASVLQRDAAVLAAAARAHDGLRVQAAVAALRRDVEAQRARQGLSAERADRVLSAAALVAADVPPPAPTPAPTPVPVATTRPPAPAPAPAPAPKKRHHDKHEG